MQYTFRHTRRSLLSSGGQIVILDTGSRITPEAVAMLQALYSRSAASVDSHISIIERPGGADKFMSRYYVGYGHKSIGDCGTTTIFLEGISMLAAKAIQDSPLYNGQESSTRYINFAEQAFIDPVGSSQSRSILESLRTTYLQAYNEVLAHLKTIHEKPEKEKEEVFQKALTARAFDIVRSLLPAGASTNVAWHTTLRHAADRLMILRHHPLDEVRTTAAEIEAALLEAYPSSFSTERYEGTESYVNDWVGGTYYYDALKTSDEPLVRLEKNSIDSTLLRTHKKLLSQRPAKTELPKMLAECGTVRFGFLLDYGSYRDLQRHRAVSQRMPLLTMKHGFGPWYLAHLPRWAPSFLKEHRAKVASLKLPKEVQQYYIPMGYRVACRLTGDIPALVYLVELRSGISVHPTLRTVAQHMGKILYKKFNSSGLTLHIDEGSDRFNAARGTQDIVKRKKGTT